MYNRYVRNDSGSYSRIPEDAPQRPAASAPPPQQTQAPPSQQQTQAPPPQMPPQQGHMPSGSGGGEQNIPPSSGPPPGMGMPPGPPPQGRSTPISGITDGLTGFLRHILDQFHLDHVDTGDLLLLGLLFFLFREDADEELLVALGLLLIL